MNIVEKNEDSFIYYKLKVFKDINFVKHLFTSRIGWNSKNTLNNLSIIFDVSKSNIINLNQVHGTYIKVIDTKFEDNNEFINEDGDGLITNIPKIVLTTYHADCVPIYFLDKEKKAIGLAHGGWRGSFENISGLMLDKMVNIYNSNPKNILVGIGPSIGPCCYKIGKDLKIQFENRYSGFKDIIIDKGNDIYYLDLWKLNYLQLKSKGVMDENIVLSNACTSCNLDKFYSYRREKGTSNRMIAAISLTDN